MSELTSPNWAESAAGNNAAPPNGWPENQVPSSINDCAREMMASLKKWWNRDHASANVTVGGTANAVTLAYSQGPAAYVQGEKFAFKATAANTGATTVNINSLGATAVRKKTGTGAAIALTGGEIQTGDLVEIEFDGTNFQLLSTPVDSTLLTPTGAVMPYAGSSAPSGWLMANGQAVSRTTYATLFAVVSTNYGVGDGSTTFNVPDLRGRAVFGVDNMGGIGAASRLGSGATGGITGTASLGATGGEQKHTLTTPEIPSHSHTVTDPGHVHDIAFSGSTGGSTVNWGSGDFGSAQTRTATTGISIANAGGGGAHNVTPPALVLNYIIKT